MSGVASNDVLDLDLWASHSVTTLAYGPFVARMTQYLVPESIYRLAVLVTKVP